MAKQKPYQPVAEFGKAHPVPIDNRGHGAKIGNKMGPAIAALLSHPNLESAARAVGIGTTTLKRWLKEPEFAAAYHEARRDAFTISIARLQQASDLAVETVVKIMKDTKQPPMTRLRAAVVVLSYGARAMNTDDLDAAVHSTKSTVSPRSR